MFIIESGKLYLLRRLLKLAASKIYLWCISNVESCMDFLVGIFLG